MNMPNIEQHPLGGNSAAAAPAPDQKNYDHLKIQEESERELLVKWTGFMKDGVS